MAISSDLQAFLKLWQLEGASDGKNAFSIGKTIATATRIDPKGKDEALALLIIIQVAIRAKASEIAMEFLKERASLAFRLPAPSEELSPHRLARYWAQKQKTSSALTESLSQALAFLKDQGHRQITWTAASGATKDHLSISPSGIELISARQPPLRRYLYKLELSGLQEKNFMPSWSASAQATVGSRCAYLPSILTIDSRPLQGRWHTKSSPFWHSKRSLGYRLAQAYFLDADSNHARAKLWLPPVDQEHYTPVEEIWRQANDYQDEYGPLFVAFKRASTLDSHFPKPPWHCRGTAVLHLSMSGPNRISFVKDGVVLNPIVLESDGIGLEVLWDSADLRVDKTYLQLVDSKELHHSLRQIRSQLNDIFLKLIKNMGIIPAVSIEPASIKQNQLKASRSLEEAKPMFPRWRSSYLGLASAPAKAEQASQYLALNSSASLRITATTKKQLAALAERYQKISSKGR